MAVKKRKRPKKKKTLFKGFSFSGFGLNTLIFLLCAGCLAFVASATQRVLKNNKDFTLSFLDKTPSLSTESSSPANIGIIEVDVLNGCGEKGVARQFTDFLRLHRVDVVNTENASSFDYLKTHIIQGNQYLESAYRIAELFGFDKTDTTRIVIDPDFSHASDVTIIIGQDYKRIKSFQEFSSYLP